MEPREIPSSLPSPVTFVSKNPKFLVVAPSLITFVSESCIPVKAANSSTEIF